MNPERLDRFSANVDMMGDAQNDARRHTVLVASSPVSGVSEAVNYPPAKRRRTGTIQLTPIANSNNCIHAQGPVNTDFAVEAARRARLQIFAKQLPQVLSHLKSRIPANHLRRIVLSETITDDFGSNKIWVCRSCASIYSSTAKGLFEVTSFTV